MIPGPSTPLEALALAAHQTQRLPERQVSSLVDAAAQPVLSNAVSSATTAWTRFRHPIEEKPSKRRKKRSAAVPFSYLKKFFSEGTVVHYQRSERFICGYRDKYFLLAPRKEEEPLPVSQRQILYRPSKGQSCLIRHEQKFYIAEVCELFEKASAVHLAVSYKLPACPHLTTETFAGLGGILPLPQDSHRILDSLERRVETDKETHNLRNFYYF